ncbi:hypothetical protein Ndes2526B_g06134 [Nannochloris sp. 'desiccata']
MEKRIGPDQVARSVLQNWKRESSSALGLQEEAPEDVELRDRATYIVVPRDIKITEKRFESIETPNPTRHGSRSNGPLPGLSDGAGASQDAPEAWKELQGSSP